MYVDAVSTIFLLLCRTSYVPYFSFLIPICFSSSCSFVCAAVICYSPASSTCSFYLCHFMLPHLGIPLLFICLVFFRNSYFLVGVFVLSHPVR